MTTNGNMADTNVYSTVTSSHSDTKRKVSILTDPPVTNAYDNLGFESHPSSRKISQVKHEKLKYKYLGTSLILRIRLEIVIDISVIFLAFVILGG